MAQLPIMSEAGARIVISGEDVPFGAYQAIYHSLTKKVEQRSKTYKDAYDVTFDDIQDLHNRLLQLIKQYKVKSSRCQVTHQFRDDTAREHSSFDRFRMSDYALRTCSTKLNYELDFLVILPPEVPEASEIAQRYRVNLLFDQDFIDADEDMPYFVRGLMYGKNINLSIEFSDYAVSQSLYAVVDGWIAMLPTRKNNKLIGILRRREQLFRTYISSLARTAVMLGGAVVAYRASSIREGFAVILTFVGLAFLLYSITGAFIDALFVKSSQAKPSTNLLLTEGDKIRREDTNKRQRKAEVLTYFMLSGVIASLVVGVMSSAIYDYIRSF